MPDWEALKARVAALEAWVADKDKAAMSQAERAKRYRDRKKAERAQEDG